ncbi:antitoxin MazE7 [Streptomyces sp. NPDC059003]|uniref:antitoxin MazE7 n=1 Tax=Streptomyces sp. NPDC059003 TaxID=3346691 RepID=UPI003682CDD8
MADIELDDRIVHTFEDLAADAGLSVPEYLARLAEEKKRERALGVGAAAFRRVTTEAAAAFDAEFGGPTSTSRAA